MCIIEQQIAKYWIDNYHKKLSIMPRRGIIALFGTTRYCIILLGSIRYWSIIVLCEITRYCTIVLCEITRYCTIVLCEITRYRTIVLAGSTRYRRPAAVNTARQRPFVQLYFGVLFFEVVLETVPVTSKYTRGKKNIKIQYKKPSAEKKLAPNVGSFNSN